LYSAYVLFFFSSRRRHTRFSRDWSSDVCSSDLEIMSDELRRAFNRAVWGAADDEGQPARLGRRDGTLRYIDALGNSYADRVWVRSEERRVGKDWTPGWQASAGHR